MLECGIWKGHKTANSPFGYSYPSIIRFLTAFYYFYAFVFPSVDVLDIMQNGFWFIFAFFLMHLLEFLHLASGFGLWLRSHMYVLDICIFIHLSSAFIIEFLTAKRNENETEQKLNETEQKLKKTEQKLNEIEQFWEQLLFDPFALGQNSPNFRFLMLIWCFKDQKHL